MFNAISTQAHKLLELTNNVKKSSKTKLLTITSGKGGVGKSTFSANMAYILSSKGYKVVIVDADIGLANMQVLFDLKPKNTIFDYIEGKANLKEVITPTKHKNIFLVAGKSGYQYDNRNSFVFARVVNDLIDLNSFDYVLVDTGAGLNDYVKEFLLISDNVLALTTTDPSALTDVYALMKMLSKDKSSLTLCFNHTKSFKIGETISNSLSNLASKNRLNSNFMIKYVGNVSTCSSIPTTARVRKLFCSEFKNEQAALELKKVTETLLKTII